MDLVQETYSTSVTVLQFLLIMELCLTLFFGCLIFLVEGGDYTVSDEFPTGKYVRYTPFNSNNEEDSPYSIVFSCFYWALVTLTTVGYGDMYPTSSMGRIIACVAVIFGVLALAMPITVISNNFQIAVVNLHNRKKHSKNPIPSTCDVCQMIKKEYCNGRKILYASKYKHISGVNVEISKSSRNADTASQPSNELQYSELLESMVSMLDKYDDTLDRYSSSCHRMLEELHALEETEDVLHETCLSLQVLICCVHL